LLLVAGCGAAKDSRAPETQAGAVTPEAADAEAPNDAFRAPSEVLEEEPRGDDLDDLLAMEADLGRYEAQLWRAGVPVRAYAQRLEGEKALGAAEDESKPAKDAERDRTATATPPASKPAAGSGDKAEAKKGNKSAKRKAPVRPYDAAGASPGDGAGDDLRGLSKNDGDSAQRCETVCEVATAICEIEARVCDMAERHTDDPRYANACERAADDCRVATQACQHCSAG
jgi:hypothetical protein